MTVYKEYNAAGIQSETNTLRNFTGTNTKTIYTYAAWDSYKQQKIEVQPTNSSVRNWASGFSNYIYNENGHVTEVRDVVGNKSTKYLSNQAGMVLKRESYNGTTLSGQQYNYYLNNHTIGDVGDAGPSPRDYVEALATKGSTTASTATGSAADSVVRGSVTSADFNQSLQNISPNYPTKAPGSYTVQTGDTLTGIALQLWGDSSFWFLLAEANGLLSDSDLFTGQNLNVPNVVANSSNNTGTIQPYDAGAVIGDTNPTIPDAPPPPRKRCGALRKILSIVIAIVVTIYATGLAAQAWTAAGAAGAAAGTSAFSAGLSATAGVFAGGAGLATAGAVAFGAAVGSFASQGFNIAVGLQDKFNWKRVGVDALTALASFGIGRLNGAGAAAKAGNLAKQGKLYINFYGRTVSSTLSVGRQAVNSVLSNVANQQINRAFGLQKGFNWRSVGSSYVGARVGASVGGAFGEKFGSGQDLTGFSQRLLKNTIVNSASEAVRATLENRSFNFRQTAISTVGNTIANNFIRGQVDKYNPREAAQNAVGRVFNGGVGLRDNGGLDRGGQDIGLGQTMRDGFFWDTATGRRLNSITGGSVFQRTVEQTTRSSVGRNPSFRFNVDSIYHPNGRKRASGTAEEIAADGAAIARYKALNEKAKLLGTSGKTRFVTQDEIENSARLTKIYLTGRTGQNFAQKIAGQERVGGERNNKIWKDFLLRTRLASTLDDVSERALLQVNGASREEFRRDLVRTIPLAGDDDFAFALQQYDAGYEFINISKGVETTRARTYLRHRNNSVVNALATSLISEQAIYKNNLKNDRNSANYLSVALAKAALNYGVTDYLLNTKSNAAFIKYEANITRNLDNVNSIIGIASLFGGSAISLTSKVVLGAAKAAAGVGRTVGAFSGKYIIQPLANGAKKTLYSAKIYGSDIVNSAQLQAFRKSPTTRVGRVPTVYGSRLDGPNNIPLRYKTSSGAKITTTLGKTTTIIGSYPPDMRKILRELDISVQSGNIKDIVKGFADGNPGGLNFLNVTEDVVSQGSKKGGFFNYANTKWVDAAVVRGDNIIVVSAEKHQFRADGTRNGFGQEVQRFIEVHNYRLNDDGTRLLPPSN